MLVRSGREAPSVVSTRLLRTHHKNSVENFRLQERVKTIDYEIQHNYSQISDEIDGVRQNLVKIKGVKKNAGVSVERRKLLRDKGLRILPFKQNGSEDYFTVRTSQGKNVNISCSDFYDGEAMRKRLSIDIRESAVTPCIEIENSDGEELIDSVSAESRRRRNTIAWERPFRFRNITPPLRPGSRRNFRDVDEENSEDEEKLLKNLSSMERKYGILRSQTVCLKRERQVSPRPRSRTCPVNFKIDEVDTTPHRKKLSRKISGTAGNTRKKSCVNHSVANETNTADKTTKQLVQSDDSKPQHVYNDNAVLEETNPSIRPIISSKSITIASGLATSSGISRTVVDMRRMSLDKDKPTQLPPASSGGKWFQPDTPESSPRGPRKSVVTTNEDAEKVERKLSKIAERKISWKDSAQDNGNSKMVKSGRNNASQPSNESSPGRNCRRENVLSTNNQSSHDGRAQSAPQPRPSTRKASRRSSQHFVYDARPDKALCKGYVTMQMTIGNKQVKVYVPKFTTDCLDDAVERARAKSAVGGISRPLAAKRR